MRYLNRRTPLEEPVQLQRTKKFHMRNSAERVELFHLLAKLIWYLVSGRSHVGYLFNYPDNPIHKIGREITPGMPRGIVVPQLMGLTAGASYTANGLR